LVGKNERTAFLCSRCAFLQAEIDDFPRAERQ